MRKILFTIVLLCGGMTLFAQTPGNNIGRPLSEMKQKFPELRYLKTDETGMKYQDGYFDGTSAIFFYFRNNKVVEECMMVQSNDGFARSWYDQMVDSFISNYSPICGVNGYSIHVWCYDTFVVHLNFYTENGTNTAMLLYEAGGCGYLSGMTPKEFFEKYNSK